MDTVIIGDQDFALTSDSLRLMQQAWESLQQLVRLGAVGDDRNYILSGCEQVGNVVAPGVVVLNGEMLPFDGGSANTYISAAEQSAVVTVGAGSYTEVVRYAQWGTGTDQQLWATMRNKRPSPKCHHEIISLPIDDFVVGGPRVYFPLPDYIQGDFSGATFFDIKVTWLSNDGTGNAAVTVANNNYPSKGALSGVHYFKLNGVDNFLVWPPDAAILDNVQGLILQFSWI